MLEISGKTNLLEQNAYKYSLQDVAEPNLQTLANQKTARANAQAAGIMRLD